MTLVEFFDISPLQNISGALRFPVDTVYFVGTNNKKMQASAELCKKIWQRFGKNIDLKVLCVPKYDIQTAIDRLCDIISKDDRVIMDVSGGDDYLLACCGIAYERCKSSGVQLHHQSVRSNKFISFGEVICPPYEGVRINLTCDELIQLHGGKIIYENQKKNGTVKWDFETQDFRGDVEKMWNICRRDNRQWNRFSAKLGELEGASYDACGNRFSHNKENRNLLRVEIIKSDIRGKEALLNELMPQLKGLYNSGLITEFSDNDYTLSFKYKSRQVRQCLVKAGTVLELVTYLAAVSAVTKNGKRVYSDAMSGVVLDWDGTDNDKGNTENEIDGFFVKGMIPVFVSCKNGGVDENELYKLSSVANRFGIKYAKKVLVATDLQKNYTSLKYFKARADEMGVVIIDGVHRMTFSEISKKLANI